MGKMLKLAAPLMDTRLFERDIPGMGTVSVTGMLFGRWSVAAKALTENGHGIYFAEPAEQGGYEVVKELDGRRNEPVLSGRRYGLSGQYGVPYRRNYRYAREFARPDAALSDFKGGAAGCV